MNWALVLTFFDVYLAPMLHVGGMPFKIAFLIIAARVLMYPRVHKFVLPFVILIVVSWLGKFYSYVFLSELEFKETVWYSLNYTVIILGFLFGRLQEPRKLNWIFWLGTAYFLVHFAVQLTWDKFPFFVEFYNLQERVDSGLLALRAVSVFSNPNIAALAMNLILLFWVVAKQYHFITYKGYIYDVLLFMMGGLVVLSTVSRSGLLAFALILGFHIFKIARNIIPFIFKMVVPAVILTVGLLFVWGDDGIYFSVIDNGLDTVFNFENDMEREVESGARPSKYRDAISDFTYSPLWGVGYDQAGAGLLTGTWYHSDLSEILVASGIIGLFAFFVIIWRAGRMSVVMVVPFVFPGFTNSFMFTVQLCMTYFIFLGIIYRKQLSMSNLERMHRSALSPGQGRQHVS